jgi:opacity protein-like surface antigen
MNRNLKLILSAVSLSVLAVGHSCAEESTNSHSWRLGANYRFGFNLKASFRNAGRTPHVHSPSVNGRSYYDGFVGLDSTGNAPDPGDPQARGLTSFWGFDAHNQIVPEDSAGLSLLLHYSEPGALGQGSDDVDMLSHGFEITLGRELVRGKKWRLGVEAGVGLSWVDGRWSGAANPNALGADSFLIPGIFTPPSQVPYPGVYESFGNDPLLQVNGSAAGSSPSTASACLDATILAVRVGPYLEYQLSQRVLASIGGGLSGAWVDGSASFQQNIAGVSDAYHGSQSDWVWGFYLSGQVTVVLSERWDLMGGVQYHVLDPWSLRVGDKVARIGFDGTWYFVVGAGYHF